VPRVPGRRPEFLFGWLESVLFPTDGTLSASVACMQAALWGNLSKTHEVVKVMPNTIIGSSRWL
jgi:hypothetical protein